MGSSIELKNRLFPAYVVKLCCEQVYGSPISKSAWCNWRKWVGVKTKWYRFDQLCCLYAIAYIRSKPKNKRKELRADQIKAVACKAETHEILAAVIHLYDREGFVFGRDAVEALKLHNISVSLATLYRNVPAFSLDNYYRIEYLVEFATA